LVVDTQVVTGLASFVGENVDTRASFAGEKVDTRAWDVTVVVSPEALLPRGARRMRGVVRPAAVGAASSSTSRRTRLVVEELGAGTTCVVTCGRGSSAGAAADPRWLRTGASRPSDSRGAPVAGGPLGLAAAPPPAAALVLVVAVATTATGCSSCPALPRRQRRPLPGAPGAGLPALLVGTRAPLHCGGGGGLAALATSAAA